MRRPPSLQRALVAAVGAFNRNPWTRDCLGLVSRGQGEPFNQDGLWTYHDHSFVDDPRFARAYRRAVEAAGFDYEIRWRVHTVLWAAQHAVRLEGAFVECGTGRGFFASAICEYLDWAQRPFYLFDTFLPFPPDESGSQEGGEPSPYYATDIESVANNFAQLPGVKLKVVQIPGGLVDVGPVAFLHVDLNHADSEGAAVRHFWPQLATGSVMAFDDYGFQGFEASRESADRLGRELGYSVLTLPTGQGLVVKA